ncbi:UvrD-helicase domain-containing protein [Subtercola sp. RTI3]|uniref:UvrD-helicase domain-containing protein n=1 Tax=Subtercola sp. RTI3 TaxID=3048639 RepID=UPI002B23C967|nr:UvrD-helicase domain-containing protein [Subtercola sp. RTI3]MEA9987065.1 UvrD-helicase domain-containing protein [Subtercola sp. RTI3]
MTEIIFADAADRERINGDIDRHLFVKAGAGSGKTHHLVERILSLLASGLTIGQLAAITFTEKAAGELRQRVRNALVDGGRSLSEEQRQDALDGLDAAPIGTIHSFAARVLEDNPIEAGLPPAIEVIDELRSNIAFGARWQRIRTTLFSDPTCVTAMEILLAAGMTLPSLEQVVHGLDASWDRIPVTGLSGVTAQPAASIDLEPIIRQALELMDERTHCTNDQDKLLPRFDHLERWIVDAQIAAKTADLARSLELLGKIPGKGTGGQAGNWVVPVVGVKAGFDDLVASGKDVAQSAIQPSIDLVVSVAGTVVREEAVARQHRGQLEFHDLLVLSRDLVTGAEHTEVHARLHARYPRILLDEFQDTDPLQAELAIRIASPTISEAGDWEALTLPPGRLFVVGDPKQSIYRFRRADIGTYLTLQDLTVAADADAAVAMTTNFRSTRPVIEWVNTVFGALISADGHRQPEYEPLTHNPERAPWDDGIGGPSVVVLGGSAEDAVQLAEASARERREVEAFDVAATIVRALGHDGEPAWLKESTKPPFERTPLEQKDICILLPSRTSLTVLENALERANIEFVAEASSLVYSTPEMHDLLLALKAIANTADEAALVLSLRTFLFGCGDDDLLRWHVEGGRWSLFAPAPTRAGLENGPVGLAIAALREVHRLAATSTPASLLDELVTTRLVREVVYDSPRYRDVWRRIRFVIDQARAWSEATFGSLRDYLDWAEQQSQEGARVKESIVPDSGVNAVRISTIHGAKGRQFPMVIVSGMSSRIGGATDAVLWDDSGRPLVRFKAASVSSIGAESLGFKDAATEEASFLRAERLRLLYVACTRAETHLVVSAYPPKPSPSYSSLMREGLAAAPATTLEPNFNARLPDRHDIVKVGPLPDWDEWQRERADWSTKSAAAASISVTALAHAPGAEGPAGGPVFVDELADAAADPIRSDRAGQHGTEFGTAVHRVLELSGLENSDELDDIAARVASAAGIGDSAELARFARNALRSEPVARAAELTHWLELPLAAPHDDLVIEGVVDLLYREDDDSLVIVDFKTDISVLDDNIEAYWRQLSTYANLIQDASGEIVSGLALVFCRSHPAQVFRRVLE